MKKILCFITKATSSLDYLIPLISQSEKHNFSFEIIFWDNKELLFKGQPYYSEILKNVKLTDVNQLIATHLSPLKIALWSSRIYKRLKRSHSDDIAAIAEKIIRESKPDLIIYDHREIKRFGTESLKEILLKSKPPTILIPHAPHHTGTEAFVPFTKETPLPSHFRYWTAFKYDDYSGNFSESQKKQFKYVGYPGLDSAFLDQISSQNKPVDLAGDQKIKVVLILRKIFPKEILEQPKNHDNFAFFYKEFFDLLTTTHRSLGKSLKNFELHLKPHPATNLQLLDELIKETGFKNVFIDNNSIFAQLSKFDLFLSFYTTTILIPIANKKLCFILDSRIQNEIRSWEPMRKLYDDSPNFLREISSLTTLIDTIRQPEDLQNFIDKCYLHLRDYYPDNSCEVIFNEMKGIINATKE